MEKVHIKDAVKDGFIIDTCCNPPIAYKGPRFQPTTHRQCYTELESELLAKTALLGDVTALLSRVSSSSSPFSAEALALLTQLKASEQA